MSTLRTWPSTVRSVSTRRRAIALLVRPSAISESTSRSRVGQRAEGVGVASEQRCYDLWVQGRAASGDALGRLEELGHVEHAVLEQVAEAALGDEPDRPGGLDVLGQHQHADVRVGVADPAGRADALVAERRRHPDVDDGEVGLVLADGGAEAVGVVDGGDHVVAGILEQPAETLSEQDLVLGDHYPHGSSAVTRVPRPGGLSTLRLPPSAATRSVMPASPEPLGRDGAADAVVADADDEAAVLASRR